MATLGFSTLVDMALPDLWDEDYLKKVKLRSGETLDGVVGDVQTALRLLNNDLLSMPHYAGMMAIEDEIEIEYPVGSTGGVEEATEYGTPTPRRGATTGHMLPCRKWDRAMGWTRMGLEGARRSKIDSDVAAAVRDLKADWQKQTLRRLFKMEGETVGSTANASVPLADGGTVDSNYVPPNSPDGEEFLYTHDHFLRLDGITQANLLTVVEHLQEHGHEQPFELLVARADLGSWTNKTNVTGYAAPGWQGIQYARDDTRAMLEGISQYHGYIDTDYGMCRIWATPRIPTGYYGLYKSYGPGDGRNPVRVRIDPIVGWGWRLVPGDWVMAPQLLAVMYAAYGMGIGTDRTNGVCVENDSSGDYATPTIS